MQLYDNFPWEAGVWRRRNGVKFAGVRELQDEEVVTLRLRIHGLDATNMRLCDDRHSVLRVLSVPKRLLAEGIYTKPYALELFCHI
jgi:hypothetical protein